jgi:hypothetical protein
MIVLLRKERIPEVFARSTANSCHFTTNNLFDAGEKKFLSFVLFA